MAATSSSDSPPATKQRREFNAYFMRQFVISDIHGCHRTLLQLLDTLAFSTADELYLLGDYVDRGPDSKGVIDRIGSLRSQGYRIHCLRGNHEEMMIDARRQPSQLAFWYRQGGAETLASFHCQHPRDIDDRYWNFLDHLPHFFEVGRYLLVHAGFNFRATDPLEDYQSMLWIRNWHQQIDKEWLADRIIVHGHTPTPRKNIEWLADRMDDFRVMTVDNGCVYRGRDLGALCGLELHSHRVYFQQSVE